jgi:hypothetical protein
MAFLYERSKMWRTYVHRTGNKWVLYGSGMVVSGTLAPPAHRCVAKPVKCNLQFIGVGMGFGMLGLEASDRYGVQNQAT